MVLSLSASASVIVAYDAEACNVCLWVDTVEIGKESKKGALPKGISMGAGGGSLWCRQLGVKRVEGLGTRLDEVELELTVGNKDNRPVSSRCRYSARRQDSGGLCVEREKRTKEVEFGSPEKVVLCVWRGFWWKERGLVWLVLYKGRPTESNLLRKIGAGASKSYENFLLSLLERAFEVVLFD